MGRREGWCGEVWKIQIVTSCIEVRIRNPIIQIAYGFVVAPEKFNALCISTAEIVELRTFGIGKFYEIEVFLVISLHPEGSIICDDLIVENNKEVGKRIIPVVRLQVDFQTQGIDMPGD